MEPKSTLNPSFFVSHNSPNNPSNQQTDHLNAYNKFTAVPDLGSIEAQRCKAFDADDSEKQQIVDVYKVSKRGHDNGDIENG